MTRRTTKSMCEPYTGGVMGTLPDKGDESYLKGVYRHTRWEKDKNSETSLNERGVSGGTNKVKFNFRRGTLRDKRKKQSKNKYHE